MNNEIKEILEFDFQSQGERIEINEYERDILKDYITNLEQKCENQRLELVSLNDRLKEVKKSNGYLKQENEEWFKLSIMQNKREYRSKFLKDFQKEHGKNVFPDYDEIYKRYDKLKKENERLNMRLLQEQNIANFKLRCEKAIEILEQDKASASFNTAERIALNILKGGE